MCFSFWSSAIMSILGVNKSCAIELPAQSSSTSSSPAIVSLFNLFFRQITPAIIPEFSFEWQTLFLNT
ncbi:hypothetical protein PO909_031234, partial [Leuciscus waleckii]